ncbi:ABC transporter substrate-binding protein [Dactylosporangium sp. AC04546]|uniref:ABC transporter substrate-binding protein n=1 Tax=Dactylosporangium sp. AC04546 TaxID=2862460 RepID=UPI001EDE2527|nr:ABC transporter substrate-binding protein [Dactylosporangium sp. AC04546]WVK83748.1 ABC transporter substrate-binding protein [Dactylosporangium sp. AC04546]
MRARPAKVIVGVITAIGLLVAATACSDTAQSDGDTAPSPQDVRLYGSDGNMANSFGEALKDSPAVLAGMKGTTPLTPLSEDFKRRVKSVDATLTDFNYSGESYDAVVVAALAAEAARSVEPAQIAKQIVGVTTGDNVCETVAACLAAAKQGRDFKYRGVSLRRSGFTEVGEPSSAMYGVLNFGRNNTIDDAKTEFVGAGDEKTEHKGAAPTAGGPPKGGTKPTLKFGLLLPKTGALAFQGPPMFAAAKLAIKEINEAGGVLGQPVQVIEGDDGTNPDVAKQTVESFINGGVHVIIGAGASGVSKAVIPRVAAAGKVMISPSATSDELTKVDDKGLFFRTSPPDVLQAKAIADIIMRDGHTKVAIIARDDTYGSGLAEGVRADLTAAGIKANNLLVLKYEAKDTYDPKADAKLFTPLAAQIKTFGATGILLVGFDESALAIKALIQEKVKA